MQKEFKFESQYGGKYDLSIELHTYSYGKTLAIQTYCKDETGFVEPWDTLTTNLPDSPFIFGNRIAVKAGDEGKDRILAAITSELGVKFEQVKTPFGTPLMERSGWNSYKILRIVNPEVLKENSAVSDPEAINNAIEVANEERLEEQKEKETDKVDDGKISLEEAREKLASGEWDNERFNDAWFSGEIREADDEPEEIGNYESSNDDDSDNYDDGDSGER